jgi:Flp pilus assembly protein TadD
MMKLTALSIALIAALGVTAGCSTQTISQVSKLPAVAADADAQYALGRYYQGQQRYELSIAAYRLALAANPAHVGAHNGLGASLLLSGRSAEAVEQFKVGLKHHPRSASLWNNLGYAYALGGENKLAEIAYRNSLDIDPNDYKTNTNLAMVQQPASQAAPDVVVTTTAPARVDAATPIAAAQPAVQIAAAESSTIPAATKEPAAASAAAAPAPMVAAPVKAAVLSAPAPQIQAIPAEPLKPAVTSAAPAPAVTAATPVKATAPSAPAPQVLATPAVTVQPSAAPTATAQAVSAIPAVKVQPSGELAAAGPATETATVQVAKVAPRVYEVNIAQTQIPAITATATKKIPVYDTDRVSEPLREDVIKTAAASSDDFVLEIRNGNGVRRLAWRTSQYLAEHGYTTKRLTNQRGFNVQVTRIFYLPGYIAEAQKLLDHLPKDTVITETSNLRRGIHVRVVLGKDMVQHQAGLDAAQAKIRLAAL